eukprot:254756-Pleurochrysis_carterae.AAC.1
MRWIAAKGRACCTLRLHWASPSRADARATAAAEAQLSRRLTLPWEAATATRAAVVAARSAARPVTVVEAMAAGVA